MNDQFWMVVDVSQVTENADLLPHHKAPRYMHASQSSAESECLRLAESYPDGEFVVLEAKSKARRFSNEWANLTKKGQTRSIRIVDLDDGEDWMPF